MLNFNEDTMPGRSCYGLVIALLVFLMVFLSAAVNTAKAASTQPGGNTSMPALPDILKVIDKATTAEQGDKPAEWTGPVKLVIVFTLLAVIPSLLAMTTSFTRIIIVLSFVRKALGTQSIPPNTVMIGLALFLTLFTMAPTFGRINTEAVQPYLENKMDIAAASQTAGTVLKDFMIRQTRTNDLALFVKMAKIQPPQNPAELPAHIIVPSFVISEFRTSFEIGCLLFIPFLLLDLVISGILLSAGMMMLPPVMISLPFKLILFILIDGWGVLAEALSLSFR